MENYHVDECIGSGSFGKVYRGRRKYTSQTVALKFVSKRGKSARELENVRQEIAILQQLDHINIIAMLDSFETESEFCMVTEYALGELFEVLEHDQVLPEEEIRKISVQLVHALHILHSKGIIHRDMKPQNILIGAKQQIKVCDFGFAKSLKAESVLTSMKGTALYIAPELVREQPYNFTADLWSLGVILYELYVGKTPFYTDRIVTVLQKIVNEPVIYPSTMSPNFQNFLNGLLQKDPTKRMSWSEILNHPFVTETAAQRSERKLLQAQVKPFPRFFKLSSVDHIAKDESCSDNNSYQKPSLERLRSIGDWSQCDPATGRKIDAKNATAETNMKEETKGRTTHSPEHDTQISANFVLPDEVNISNNSDASEYSKVENNDSVHNIRSLWIHIKNGYERFDEVSSRTELAYFVLGSVDSIALVQILADQDWDNQLGFKNSVINGDILQFLHLTYRSLLELIKQLKKAEDIDKSALRGSLAIRSKLQSAILHILNSTPSNSTFSSQASEIIHAIVRCTMVCTRIFNQIHEITLVENLFDGTQIDDSEFLHRRFYSEDIQVFRLLLQRTGNSSVNRAVSCSSKNNSASISNLCCKTLKWLGSAIDGANILPIFLEEIHQSGIIALLCGILEVSKTLRSPGGTSNRKYYELGRYCTFALSSLVQPDCHHWLNCRPFPLTALSSNFRSKESPNVSPSVTRKFNQVHSLRSKLHTEVATELGQAGLSELISMLHDEISKNLRNQVSDNEDDDASIVGSILRLLLHSCRSSSRLTKRLASIAMAKQYQLAVSEIDTDSISSAGAYLMFCVCQSHYNSNSQSYRKKIETSLAVDILTVMLRRGVLNIIDIWQIACLLFSKLQVSNNIFELSALAAFFAEATETIQESQLEKIKRANKLNDDGCLILEDLLVHGITSTAWVEPILNLFAYSERQEISLTLQEQQMKNILCYNIRTTGLLDSGVALLLKGATRAAKILGSYQTNQSKLLQDIDKRALDQISLVYKNEKPWEKLKNMLDTGGNDLLSPYGVFCCLKLFRIVRELQCILGDLDILFIVNERILPTLVGLLHANHITALAQWPNLEGGGKQAVKALVHAVVKVMGMFFVTTQYDIKEELTIRTQDILYEAGCVAQLLGALEIAFTKLQRDLSIQFEPTFLELPISLLCRLVTSSDSFCSQFIDAKGVIVMKHCAILKGNRQYNKNAEGMAENSGNTSYSASLIIDALLILNHLARTSEDYYKPIIEADVLEGFYSFLHHEDATVRAKVLICIGNLCNHSDAFYGEVCRPIAMEGAENSGAMTLLNAVVNSLADHDQNVRRFACFAVGNLAFHNSVLYKDLSSNHIIPLLLDNLVNGSDSKTCVNAIGAIANLVRNSGELCDELCQHDIPFHLFKLTTNYVDEVLSEQSRSTTEKSTLKNNSNILRVVLFTLGNICAHPGCVISLKSKAPHFEEKLGEIYERLCFDEIAMKHIRRILMPI